MSTSRGAAAIRWLAALLLAVSCGSDDNPLTPGLAPPDAVTATPLGLSSIRLDWTPEQGAELQNFRIERRVDLQGEFKKLADVSPSTTTYFDTGLKPATFYGYRIITMSRAGEQSGASIVAGARTAPVPGVRYSTSLEGGTETAIADPNGYQLSIRGPTKRTMAIGTLDEGTVAPLAPGDYTITLSDVLPTCSIRGDTVRQVTVVDTGVATQTDVSFTAFCVDPTRGSIFTRVTVQGDSTDTDGYDVEYAGILPGSSIPALGGILIPGIGGSHPFGGLAPGDYEITIGDVHPPCVVSGPTSADVQVAPLSSDTVTFQVTCPDKGGGNPSAPLVFTNLWNPQTAASGHSVDLDIALDLTGIPAQDLGVVQAELKYDPAVLTFQSAIAPSPGQLGGLTVNSSVPGSITWLNFSVAAAPPTGVVPAARFTFLVTGASGTRAITRSTIQLVADFAGANALDTLFRVVEDTLAVGAGSGDQSPSAQAGGPYSGTAGAAIFFSSSGSSDPDGNIAGFSWAFGDGATSTQPNPSHSFTAAGGYTATLTVTDNQGATGTDQATVTVTGGGGGGNQAPIAHANGPYSGTVGAGVSLSSGGSNDPDGSIAGYSWDFGDGNTGTGASPTHTYSASGSYTATLTVTDNQGGTASDAATVTISAASGQPFTWSAAFGAFEPVTQTVPLTITLDLSNDISQTPGPEALQSWVVDSLQWDPAVLQYFSFNYGPGGGGSVNPTDAVGGCKCELVFSGTQPGSASSGVITLGTIRFRFLGASGATTTTATSLGPLLGTPGTGSFNYRSFTLVQEATVTVP